MRQRTTAPRQGWHQCERNQPRLKFRKQLTDTSACNASHMRVQRIVHSEVIPDDRPTGAKDAIDLSTEITGHLRIENGGEHGKHCHQIEKAILKWQSLGV